MPRNDAAVARRFVEDLVVPETHAPHTQQLADRRRHLGREDDVVKPGIHQPGAQEMKHHVVRPLEVSGLDFVEPIHVLVQASTDQFQAA